MYCFTRNCADARCIAAHAATAWAICPTCDGSECSCRETLTRCDCTGGLVEIERPAADVIELAAYTAEAAEGY
ncbi:hypothetical protein ATM97_09145 [Nocardia sp. MH4]|nr:hypothetical protein [Nocardia sp. MH4]